MTDTKSELHASYKASFSQKIDALRSTHDAVINGDQPVSALRRLLHNLSGSAGSYGYPVIQQCAAELEQALINKEVDVKALSGGLEKVIAALKAKH